jgi:hypothetical protein
MPCIGVEEGQVEIVKEYLRRAEECRTLAKTILVPEHRKKIEKICDMWARLAEERRQHLNEMEAKRHH